MGSQTSIRTNLLITTAVIVTVFLALFMSQQDGGDGDALLAVLVETIIPADAGGQTTPTTILLPTTTALFPTAMATAVIADAGEKTAVSLLPHCENAPTHWLPHTVRDGETIYTLSISSGATIAEIRQANCLAMGQSITGATVYLPPLPPTRIACGPPSYWQSQLVYAGDTLYALAVRHGTTIYAIMQANCLSSSYLMAGRTLYLPPVVVVPTAVLPTATPTIAPPTPTVAPTITPIITTTIAPTVAPTVVPTSTETAVPTVTAVPTSTFTPTVVPTTPPITPTITATVTPLPTVVATETAVFTPTTPPTSTPVATPLPPTATVTP